jgi:hypothetical protein
MLSAGAPLTVNRIAAFLARRMRSAEANRILLIVLDGMGLAQWAVVRDLLNLNVQFASTSLAMIPTLTAISRQAIFAGRLPVDFAEGIRTTDGEPKRWSNFWAEEGVPSRDVAFHVLLGAEVDEVPSLQAGFPVVGLVVKAIDEMLHGAKLLGDAQLHSAIETWVELGFLQALLREANTNGYETWITSDHGNLETLPSGRIMEGLMVESAGVRVRCYPDETLRNGRLADGEPWDPPGLPDGIYPLFAPGRSGYFSGRVRVTHGGISMDEVFVPLARVSL